MERHASKVNSGFLRRGATGLAQVRDKAAPAVSVWSWRPTPISAQRRGRSSSLCENASISSPAADPHKVLPGNADWQTPLLNSKRLSRPGTATFQNYRRQGGGAYGRRCNGAIKLTQRNPAAGHGLASCSRALRIPAHLCFAEHFSRCLS